VGNSPDQRRHAIARSHLETIDAGVLRDETARGGYLPARKASAHDLCLEYVKLSVIVCVPRLFVQGAGTAGPQIHPVFLRGAAFSITDFGGVWQGQRPVTGGRTAQQRCPAGIVANAR
jgi:hypothetical protein